MQGASQGRLRPAFEPQLECFWRAVGIVFGSYGHKLATTLPSIRFRPSAAESASRRGMYPTTGGLTRQ